MLEEETDFSTVMKSDNDALHFAGPSTSTDSTKQSDTGSCRMCVSCMRPCLTRHNSMPPNPTIPQKLCYAFMCPAHGVVAEWCNLALVTFITWAVFWSITVSDALPGGNFFALFMLVVFGVIAGEFMKKISLPPLLGMLLVGCLLRNVPVIDVAKDIDPTWSGALRNIALVVILIRAGLGLDPVALRKLSWGVLRLAFTPCLVETVCAAVTSHLFLGFPWLWGFMLGFVLSAVSPAVVVPSMLSLTEKGLGVNKGIPTLVIAAASVDDVLAISGFGVILGITFSKGNLVWTIVKGPLEAVAGILYGVILGVLIWYLPHPKQVSRELYRFVCIFGGGLLAAFGSRVADISGAGALGCLTLAFVAAVQWRKEIPESAEMAMCSVMAQMWKIFQPLLFGLIGAEIDLGAIEAKTIGLGLAVLFIGLAFRCVASFFAVWGLGLTMKEKLFIPIAWLPKATVQAAIGAYALDAAREKNSGEEFIQLGSDVLTIAVLVILITAPLGAAAIALAAPRLLDKCATDNGIASPENRKKNSTPHGKEGEEMIDV